MKSTIIRASTSMIQRLCKNRSPDFDRPRFTVTLLAGVLLMARCVLSADYHVDPAGDDARDGRTPASAWRTLARAARQPLLPGDRLLLRRGGVWHESFYLNHPGAPGRAVHVGAYGPADDPPPTISAADEAGAPARPYCLELNQSHVRVSDLRLTGAAETGLAALVIYAHRDLSDLSVARCVIEGNGSRAIFVSGDPDRNVRGLRIVSNRIADNGGSAILLSHGSGVWIWDNVLERNCRVAHEPWQAGVRVWSERIADCRIERNTIRKQQWGHANASALGIHVDETGPGVIVSQNRIEGIDHAAIEVENARGVVVRFNRVRDAEVGVFVYRAGHDHLIRRNDIQARAQGIALQGFRAGGVDAGPEIEVNGRLFSGNRVEHNAAVARHWGSIKCVGGAETGVRLRGNDWGPPRQGLIEWGEATFDNVTSWRRAAGDAIED